MPVKKILYISHDAYRAGAQLLALGYLKWLRKNRPDIDFEILLANGGVLESEFAELGKVHHWNHPVGDFLGRRFRQKLVRRMLLHRFKQAQFDLIYSNTIVNGQILHALRPLNLPVVTHVHELNYWITRSGEQNFELVKSTTQQFIAASEAVKLHLIDLGLDSKIIKVIYEFTDVERLLNAEKKSLKSLLSLGPDTMLIGASGAENWRKGKDLFIPLAINIIKRTNKNVHFIWIGGEVTAELKEDLDKSGYADRIHFINHISGASSYFHEFDVFAMLSREDPFPVVNLEAGALSVPIVCFDGAGGTPELLAEEKKLIVPYLDIDALGQAVVSLLEDETGRRETGRRLSERIIRLYNIETVCSNITQHIENFIE